MLQETLSKEIDCAAQLVHCMVDNRADKLKVSARALMARGIFSKAGFPMEWTAQFSLNNMHKGGIKQHHFTLFSNGLERKGNIRKI